MVLIESAVDVREDSLGGGLASSQIVVSVRQDFRLYDRHQSGSLTDRRVPGEHIGILDDGQLRRFSISNFEDASPFGEGTAGFVLGATLFQTVQALSRHLVAGAQQIHNALVHFDANLGSAFLDEFNKRGSVIVALVKRLVKEDDSADVLERLLTGSKQNLAVGASVGLDVVDLDGLEALAHGAVGLVGSKNSLSRRHDPVGGLGQGLLLLGRQERHDESSEK